MSGGTFDYNQYILNEIAEELEERIQNNDNPGSPDYSPRVIGIFTEVAKELRVLKDKVDAIDKLIAGDTGEDDLEEIWKEINERN